MLLIPPFHTLDHLGYTHTNAYRPSLKLKLNVFSIYLLHCSIAECLINALIDQLLFFAPSFHSNNTIITNNSIEDDEEDDEGMPGNTEGVESTKEEEGSIKEGEGSLRRCSVERDQSNLTVIYESDDESTKL